MNKEVEKTFNKYKENKNLNKANIFHLYDTGEECYKDNSGYHDARHFNLIAFNTETMEKIDMGRHDGIHGDYVVVMAKIFMDGSTLIKTKEPLSIINTQCVMLYSE